MPDSNSNSGSNLPGPKSSFADRIARDAGKNLGRRLSGPTGRINRKKASSLPPKPSRQAILEEGWTGTETIADTVKAGPKWFRRTAKIVVFSVVGGLVGAVAYSFLRKRPAPEEILPQSPPERSLATQMLSSKDEAERVVRDFFQAGTAAEKTAVVRGGKSLLPAMERFYASHPDEPALPAGSPIFDSETSRVVAEFDRDGRRLLQATIRDAAGRPHCCLLERRPEGLRLDWRALLGLGDGDRTLAELTANPPAAPVTVRAVLAAGNQTSPRFPDPATHQPCVLSDYSNTTRLTAFLGRSSEAWKPVNEAFQKKFTALLTGRPASGPVQNPVLTTSLPEPEGATPDKPAVLLLTTLKVRFLPPSTAGAPAEGEIVGMLDPAGWLDRSAEVTQTPPEASQKVTPR